LSFILYNNSQPPKRKRKIPNTSDLISNDQSSLIKDHSILNQQPSSSPSTTNDFTINIQGVIESAQFFSGDAIYCKYDIMYGSNWKIISGQKSGQSQHSCQSEGVSNYFVWNLPFNITLTSSIPTGWPQIVVSCFYPDFFGREILKAYGAIYIPTQKGRHTRTIQMFCPISSSVIANALGYIFGQKAEIINAPKVLATGEGREILRTQSEGALTVKLNITLSHMDELGYNFE
jgi:B9 domain-containing protein 1